MRTFTAHLSSKRRFLRRQSLTPPAAGIGSFCEAARDCKPWKIAHLSLQYDMSPAAALAVTWVMLVVDFGEWWSSASSGPESVERVVRQCFKFTRRKNYLQRRVGLL